MAENTEDETLADVPNIQPDNPSDDIIPTQETANSNPNQETANMEVHHHPDLHHKPKKWKEYFLEFLMIFLAVTMGFIAENIREHFVLKKQEKEFMVSLVRDLNNDMDGLAKSEILVKGFVNAADSIFILFKNADYKNTSADICYFGRQLGLRNLWRSNDGTIQQLTYSGGLRLIDNKKIIDSIQDYISTVKVYSQILSLEDNEISEYRKAMSKVFSGFAFNDMINIKSKNGKLVNRINYNPGFQSITKTDINDLAVQIAIVKGNRITQLGLMEDLKTKAGSLIKLIGKEYGQE